MRKPLRKTLALLFFVSLVICLPVFSGTGQAATVTVSTNGALKLVGAQRYQTISKEWTAPYLQITQVRFTGDTQYYRNRGTLYYWNGSSWQQLASDDSTFDTWINLPPGVNRIKLEYYSYYAYGWVDVPEVKCDTSVKAIIETNGALTVSNPLISQYNYKTWTTSYPLTRVRLVTANATGYLYVYAYNASGQSSQVVYYYYPGTKDQWLTIPASLGKATKVEIRWYPSSGSGQVVDIPEVECFVPVTELVPSKPNIQSGGAYWNTTVSWPAVTGPNITYELWRKTLNSNGAVIEDKCIYSGTATSYTTTDQSSGKYYLYRMRVKANGETSKFSPEACFWTAATPSVLSAGPGSVTLSIPKVMNGLTYKVLYKPQGTSSVSSVNTTSLTPTITGLNPLQRYEFGLAPVLSDGGTDWWAGWATGTPYALTPGTPTFGSKGQTSLQVSWATVGNPSGTKYEFNWKASTSSTWSSQTTTSTSLAVSSLTPGTTYDFRVRAFNLDNVPSAFSAVGSCPTVPATPTVLRGNSGPLGWSNSAGRGWVTLNWDPVPGATGYKVWVFDGNTYRPLDVGNVLSWDSRQAKIYPSESELDAFVDNSIDGSAGTVSLGTTLQIALNNYQSGSKEWTSSSAITQVRFKGTRSDYDDQAYLEYWDGSKWVTAQSYRYSDSYNWDTWVNIPAGITKIRTRLSTDYYSTNPVRTIEVPEVKVSYQPLHVDKSGLDLRDDPNKLYKKTVGATYDSSHNYWFRISAYNESGESPYSDVLYGPTLPNRTDTAKPTGSILINGDQMVTGSPSVSLALTYSDPVQPNYTADPSDDASGVARMRFSNDGSSWTSWLTAQESYAWTLDPNGFGEKTVYAQFMDNAGNVSSALTDKINYYLVDTQAPKVTLKINGGTPVSHSQQVTLEINAEDDLSAADMMKMCFSNDYSNWTGWEDYKPYKSWTLSSGDGDKKVYVRVKDAANNAGIGYASISLQTANQGSPWENPSVFYSTSGTQGTATVNGKSYTVNFVGSSEVVLKLNAPGVTTVQYSLDGMQWLPPESVSPEKIISLPDWDGLKTVYALLPNGASYLCRFYLDKTAPRLEASWLGGATVTNGGRATLVLDADDNMSAQAALQAKIPGHYNNWVPYQQQFLLTFSGSGAQTVTVYVRDQAGNETSKTMTILN